MGYSGIEANAYKAILIASCLLMLAAISFGVASSLESVSRKKRRLRFFATLAFGSTFCLAGASALVLYWRLPLLHASGIVLSAETHTSGRDYRTDVEMRDESKNVLSLQASGRSDYFHRGEHLIVEYQADRSSILRAEFFTSTGTEEGRYRSTDEIYPYLSSALGIFLICAGWKKYKRDPEDAKAPRRRSG